MDYIQYLVLNCEFLAYTSIGRACLRDRCVCMYIYSTHSDAADP